MATIAGRQMARRPGALYFPVVTTLLLALSLIAFSDNLFTDIYQPSNSDPEMIVHSLFAAGWVILFAVQSWLIYFGRVAMHRRVGNGAFIILAGMAASTLYLFVRKFHGFAAMDAEVLANRLLMPIFIVCAVMAYRQRNRPDWHKRLLLVGSMALLEPILARVYDPVFGPFLPLAMSKAVDEALFLTFLFGSWLALLGSLMLYDRRVLGRVHRVTLAGSGAILAANLAAYLS